LQPGGISEEAFVIKHLRKKLPQKIALVSLSESTSSDLKLLLDRYETDLDFSLRTGQRSYQDANLSLKRREQFPFWEILTTSGEKYTFGRDKERINSKISFVAATDGSLPYPKPGELLLLLHTKPFLYACIQTTSKWRADATVQSLIKSYQEATTVTKSANNRASLSENCGKCHKSALEEFTDSKHSHSLNTLKSIGKLTKECMPCHQYKFEGTDNGRSMECQSCHSMDAGHELLPDKFKPEKVTESKCVNCHTSVNSVNFNYAKYLYKLNHGGKK
jgi:hypothetical protein